MAEKHVVIDGTQYFLRRGDLHWVEFPAEEGGTVETTTSWAGGLTDAGEEPTDFEKHMGNVYARIYEAIGECEKHLLDSGGLDAHAVVTMLERAKASLSKAQQAKDEER